MHNRLASKPTLKIAVIGLGYVGLPLAVRLSTHHPVIGVDVNAKRVAALRAYDDATGEIGSDEMRWALGHGLSLSSDIEEARGSDVFIITVPTPTDKQRKPDLRAVKAASRDVGRVIGRDAIVVFESTVAPGTTRNVVGSIIAEASGLSAGTDFALGYSPERINPGDKVNTVSNVTKIVAADDPGVAALLASIYGSVNGDKIHIAPSLEVAEAAKLFENTQRDVNIALMNEFAAYTDKVGISIWDVVDAMRTKWNALPFTPGLVGGHCIGEDPYYLIQDGRQRGLPMRIVAESREVNNNAARDVAVCVHDACAEIRPGRSKILIMGATFKENVPDVRNSLSFGVAKRLADLGHEVHIHDPHATPMDVAHEMGEWDLEAHFHQNLPEGPFDAVAGLVAHAPYASIDPFDLVTPQGSVYDARRIWSNNKILKLDAGEAQDDRMRA